MPRNVFLAPCLAVALSFAPAAALVHAGHDQGTKTKKIKKSKSKRAAVEFMLRRQTV